MVRRSIVLAAALLLSAGPALAQPASIPGPFSAVRMRIIPQLILAPKATRVENRVIEIGNLLEPYRAEFDLGNGIGGSLHIDVPIASPVGFYFGGGYVWRDDSREFSELEGGTRVEAGSGYGLARAGFSVRLHSAAQLQVRRVEASLFAGPTLVHELPRTDLFRTHAQAMTLFGAHFGFAAEVPLGARVALQAAAENNMVWWPDEELARRNDSVYASIGLDTSTTLTARPSHLIHVRLGLSLLP